MRRLVLQMQISVDGYVAGPDGGVDWVDFDPEMGRAHMALAEGADLALVGHAVGRNMAEFWPAVEDDADAAENERRFAELMNRMEKRIISTIPDDLGWHNASQLLAPDEAGIVAGVRRLKDQGDDGYLLLYGGVRTAQTLIRHGLVDEYRFDVPPVVLGEGLRLFETRQSLKLVDTVHYASGAIGTVYRPIED